ncbi:HAD-IA family hydrolase [Cohaesibacter intestini]|uniref:HAD-IA family hydrolase n=1 Tax=Cohaesibacter intestini TaxID=2211145 RepID=UPI000DE8F282|nr:HAD-IA family hydrolase [Cohaesibacter intestini]
MTLDINRIECLIFDLDGTLVDSEVLCQQAHCDVVPDLDWDAAYLINHYRGIKLVDIVRAIEDRIGQSLGADYETRYRARVAELFDSQLQAFPDVTETVKALDLPRCIASSGPLKKMRHSLGLTGLLPLFEPHLFSSYAIDSWKPEPDLFLHAAETMGVAPEACLVIEDSGPGIEAAKAAGMQYLLHCPDSHQPPKGYDGPHFSHYASFPLLGPHSQV